MSKQASVPEQTSTKTYGIGPAAVSTNLGEDYSHDGKQSVLHADGSVTGPDGDVIFDPAKDKVEVKTPDFDAKKARVVVDKDASLEKTEKAAKADEKKSDDE
jgi:hypothetical protein